MPPPPPQTSFFGSVRNMQPQYKFHQTVTDHRGMPIKRKHREVSFVMMTAESINERERKKRLKTS